jgi:hypothetical protein
MHARASGLSETTDGASSSGRVVAVLKDPLVADSAATGLRVELQVIRGAVLDAAQGVPLMKSLAPQTGL